MKFTCTRRAGMAALLLALADVLRPYGIKVYLSARFSAPRELGGLQTADPLDAAVRAWWRAKADEIYRLIPDVGGFLVKANFEGQPGPQDYGRNHADGANMLADVLRPHGGAVLWRAFVYAPEAKDRAAQAFDGFKPLDGRFAPNVIVQVKNGPIDFQPREPFHPLFGAMPRTPLTLELQITKEYLGFSTHLVYLGPLFEEVLQADAGHGGPVARVVDGSLQGQRLTAIAGVADIGADRNWSGSQFDQANCGMPAAGWPGIPISTPPELLLWFHHLRWDHALPSGRTLWAELVARYDRGVATVADMQRRWAALRPAMPRSVPIWRSRHARRSGGAMPAWPISSRSRGCRPVHGHPRTAWRPTRRCAFPTHRAGAAEPRRRGGKLRCPCGQPLVRRTSTTNTRGAD